MSRITHPDSLRPLLARCACSGYMPECGMTLFFTSIQSYTLMADSRNQNKPSKRYRQEGLTLRRRVKLSRFRGMWTALGREVREN